MRQSAGLVPRPPSGRIISVSIRKRNQQVVPVSVEPVLAVLFLRRQKIADRVEPAASPARLDFPRPVRVGQIKILRQLAFRPVLHDSPYVLQVTVGVRRRVYVMQHRAGETHHDVRQDLPSVRRAVVVTQRQSWHNTEPQNSDKK
jgi:hypothetical protein